MRIRKSGIKLNFESLLDKYIYIYLISYVLFFDNRNVGNIYNVTLVLFLICGLGYILQSKKIYISQFFITSLLYAAVLLISYTYTPSVDSGRYALFYYSACVFIIFILSNYLNTECKIYKLIKGLIWSGVAVAINALYFYGFDLFELARNSIAQSRTAFRIGGDIGNSNLIGMYCMFSAIFSIYLLIQRKVKHRYMYIFLSLLCSIIGLLTGSKKALLVLILGIVGLAIFKKDKSWGMTNIKSVLISGVLIASVYWVIMNIPVFSTIQLRVTNLLQGISGDFTQSDDYSRLLMVRESLRIFSEHPILGNGIYSSNYFFRNYSHNNYTEVLINTGMIGFVVFYWAYFVYGMKIISRKVKPSHIKALTYTCFMIIIVLGNALVYYFNIYFQVIMVLISITIERNISRIE